MSEGPIKSLENRNGIKIPRLVLKEDAIIEGSDVFGRKSRIVLSRADKPGWFWRVNVELVPIKMDMLVQKLNILEITLWLWIPLLRPLFRKIFLQIKI